MAGFPCSKSKARKREDLAIREPRDLVVLQGRDRDARGDSGHEQGVLVGAVE
jgi:hypothetical protein